VSNGAVDKFSELGKLLEAVKQDTVRGAFKNNGTAPTGVNLGAIPQSTITALRALSDACLKAVSEINTVNLQDGLGIPGHPGIAAV
jgi:hypothetical protein